MESPAQGGYSCTFLLRSLPDRPLTGIQLSESQVVIIDGPTGSGKSTLYVLGGSLCLTDLKSATGLRALPRRGTRHGSHD